MEKEVLRNLKSEAVQRLKSLKVNYRRFTKLDARLTEYLKEVVHHPDRHNLYELLAVERFFTLSKKYSLNDVAVKKFIVAYEFMKFPGQNGMERYKLTPVQVFQFTSILWFYHNDSDRRVVTEALLFVPRKFSKTTSVASLAVYDLLYGDANAQCYVAANSYDQAHICFEVIQSVLKNLDPKMRRFKVNREQVYNLCRGKTSFARCLASQADKLDGLNASTVIVDEYAQADSAALKNVLTSSMGVRLNPLTVVITTASEKKDTPFTEMLDAYKAILRGEMENDSVFVHIFEPDVDDEEGDPRTWRKVQPHIGITVREEFYHDAWAKAQMSSENMKEFRNKLLNIFAKDERQEWISQDLIVSKSVYIDPQALVGYRAVCSVDLSVSDDFSAVSYTIFTKGRVLAGRTTETPFHSITEYYFPKGQMDRHPNRELYMRWAEAGHLHLCEGDVVDYNLILSHILSKPFRIMGIGYDPYKSLQFVKDLECTPGVGKEYLYPIPQTYGAFTSPVETLELCLHTDRITFDPNPMTAWCFGNAIIDEDRLENRKPIKENHLKKIDGAITNVMNFYLLNNVKTIS